ncbi:hypothetical protein [Tanticharoenia sakaeratensis]|uniref:Uncharacterized protein n=1 Tax=Tanticharoenia sakaeratensis NBRC 103193 TaxID=1231623 RepID=A0A0D6MN35_9PROT|nr:hypothetical protein [Tanticharoenia sakaeratensis]GAN54846.1 hypothetical protein Tasa_031_064 [Tanticharoenia sakaeratensis NBRC 103193]GBQ21382.1 hypothetical protein AA103193_1709 [Tanticharoenia sakaeratensis NBRC 103193]
MTAYIRRVENKNVADLPDSIDDWKVLSNEDDGPMIGMGREPDTGIPVLFIHTDTPVLILTNGHAADHDLLGDVFPNPYTPLRFRTDKERLPV